jgi:hypothetical protein
MRKVITVIFTLALIGIIIIINLQTKPIDEQENETGLYVIDRATAIPNDVTKILPSQDKYPPQLHSLLYEDPVPIPGPINTAGAEDSPFILPCGCDFYFVFVPDVRIPPEKQLIDGASGIYVSKKVDGVWAEPERVLLNGDLSLDGCHFIQDDIMWFCSVRAGNYREVDLYTARYVDGEWTDWSNVGEKLNVDFQVGEMHLSSDGSELYFHSNREGGVGGTDLWVSRIVDGVWQDPKNIEAVNTADNEGMPFLNQAGDELWFNRPYLGSPAIYVSRKVDGVWSEPELIVSQFAGEPSLDEASNLYFVHHFYEDGVMLEADIYVAYRKSRITLIDEIEEQDRGYLLGLLPIPFEGQSFLESYELASETCELIPVWGRPSPYWEMVADLKGQWGELFIEDLIRGNGLVPLLHFSFIGQGMTLSQLSGSRYSLSSQEWRQQYMNSVLESVEAAKPAYLSLGNEVNRWYEKYGWSGENGFSHWVSLYEEIYCKVKELSPNTIVFCTFSREIVSENREADMSVLNYFDPDKLDLLVLTSYPHSLAGVNHPSDLPSGYYSLVADELPGKSFGFSEVAWPSMTEFGGEEAQMSFIERLDGDLTEGFNVEFILWPWLCDLSDGDFIGLIQRDGTRKLGYQAWINLSYNAQS